MQYIINALFFWIIDAIRIAFFRSKEEYFLEELDQYCNQLYYLSENVENKEKNYKTFYKIIIFIGRVVDYKTEIINAMKFGRILKQDRIEEIKNDCQKIISESQKMIEQIETP